MKLVAAVFRLNGGLFFDFCLRYKRLPRWTGVGFTMWWRSCCRAWRARGLLDLVAEAMRSGDCGEIAELKPILREDDALGQIYQAINAPALEAAYRGTARERRKFSDTEIPAVTQLFTPRWVVEFLLQNTLGKLWLDWHPESGLVKKWKWIDSSSLRSWRLGGSKNFLPPRRQDAKKRQRALRIFAFAIRLVGP